MKLTSKFFSIGLVLGALLLASIDVAQAQGAVYSVNPSARDLGKVVTLPANSTPATYVSSDQSGFNIQRVICSFTQTTISNGSPSITFKIQNKDIASGLYSDLVTSAAITTATVYNISQIAAGSGLPTTSNVSIGFPIAFKWRAAVVVAGSGSPVTNGYATCAVQ